MPDLLFVHGGRQAGWVRDEVLAAMRLQAAGAFRAVPRDESRRGGSDHRIRRLA